MCWWCAATRRRRQKKKRHHSEDPAFGNYIGRVGTNDGTMMNHSIPELHLNDAGQGFFSPPLFFPAPKPRCREALGVSPLALDSGATAYRVTSRSRCETTQGCTQILEETRNDAQFYGRRSRSEPRPHTRTRTRTHTHTHTDSWIGRGFAGHHRATRALWRRAVSPKVWVCVAL